MRILFLHKSFPGPFRLVVHTLGLQAENTILFLSEAGQKSTRPNIRRLRLAPPLNHVTHDPVENDMVLRYRRAARAGNALLLLSKDGYEPDLICASSSMPGSLFVRDIFPKAFYAVEADWFYTHEQQTFFKRDAAPVDFATARVRNLWEYNALGDCDLAFTSSNWQLSHYPDFLAKKIRVIPHGVNTAFFATAPFERFVDETSKLNLGHVSEIVSFSGPYWDQTRGFPQFLQAVPKILRARPNCHVLMLWPDRRSKARQGDEEQHKEEELCRGLLAEIPLSEQERSRVHLLGVRPLDKYRQMLRASTVHVYLTAPHALSTGFLEAMACGILVVGSDTPPVREVLEHGKNGFLCDYANPDSIAETVSGVLERAPKLAFLRDVAKRLVAQQYNAALQTKHLISLLHEGLARKKPGSTPE